MIEQLEFFPVAAPRRLDVRLGNRASWIRSARLRLELATVAASVARGRHRYHAQNMADSARRELRQLGAPEETYANV